MRGRAVTTIVWSSAASRSAAIRPAYTASTRPSGSRYPGGVSASRARSDAIRMRLLRRDRGHRGPSPALEQDPGSDQEPACDLVGAEVLREQQEREDRGDERLEVRDEGGARGPDPVDCLEPEHVREGKRADDGVGQAEPGEAVDGAVVLVRQLRT